jgi:hypothetical protein
MGETRLCHSTQTSRLKLLSKSKFLDGKSVRFDLFAGHPFVLTKKDSKEIICKDGAAALLNDKRNTLKPVHIGDHIPHMNLESIDSLLEASERQ